MWGNNLNQDIIVEKSVAFKLPARGLHNIRMVQYQNCLPLIVHAHYREFQVEFAGRSTRQDLTHDEFISNDLVYFNNNDNYLI